MGICYDADAHFLEVIFINRKQLKLFEEYTVWHAIFAMALPSMLNILVMMLYNMADMFFIGQLGDSAKVAAVSISMPVFTFLMAIGSMIGGGGCALIARTLGQKDTEKVRLYSSLCCWGGIVIGILFAVIVVLFCDPLLVLLGSNAELYAPAREYILILALGAPAMIFTTAFSSIIRAEGAVKEGMIANLISTITNVILDPVFILFLGWGVRGAAAATVIGNTVGVCHLLWYILCKRGTLSLSFSLAASHIAAFRDIVALGLPNGISSSLNSVSSALANRLLVQYGTVAVAAMAASGKVTLVISMVQMGICIGVQPLLAYNYGSGNLKRIQEILRKLSLLTITIGLAALLLCRIFSRELIHLFLKDSAALELGVQMVRLQMMTGPFLGLYYISSNFLQASGNASRSMFVSLLRKGIFFIPLIYVMNTCFGVSGNIWAHIIADALSSVTGVILMMKQYRLLAGRFASDK